MVSSCPENSVTMFTVFANIFFALNTKMCGNIVWDVRTSTTKHILIAWILQDISFSYNCDIFRVIFSRSYIWFNYYVDIIIVINQSSQSVMTCTIDLYPDLVNAIDYISGLGGRKTSWLSIVDLEQQGLSAYGFKYLLSLIVWPPQQGEV